MSAMWLTTPAEMEQRALRHELEHREYNRASDTLLRCSYGPCDSKMGLSQAEVKMLRPRKSILRILSINREIGKARNRHGSNNASSHARNYLIYNGGFNRQR